MRKIFGTVLFAAVCLGSVAQSDTTRKKIFSDLPLIASIEFQNFALPFRDMGSYFTHPGISAGTEIRLNRKGTWLQQVQGAFVLNKEMGNAFYLYTQNAFRFRTYHGLSSEVKLGVGWQRDLHPSTAYEFSDGEWKKIHGGKSLIIIPLGVSFSYKASETSKVVPFISYQLLTSLFYDDVLPLSFYNLLQVGARVSINPKGK